MLPRYNLVSHQLCALTMTWYGSYASNLSSICAKHFTDMPWSTWKRLVQKQMEIKWLLPTGTPDYHWPFRRPVFGWGTRPPLTPALCPKQKNNWPCHRLPLFMLVNTLLNIWHSRRYCRWHSWQIFWGGAQLEAVPTRYVIRALSLKQFLPVML